MVSGKWLEFDPSYISLSLFDNASSVAALDSFAGALSGDGCGIIE